MKSRSIFFTFVMLSAIVACIGPAQPPSSPPIDTDTAAFTALPTRIGLVTFTPLPTLYDNASSPGAAVPPTATVPSSTFTPSLTPLPPLPDFAEVISFSLGSGGGPCIGADRTPNSITVNGEGRFVFACFWLEGIDINQPFIVSLSQPDDPNGDHFESPRLFFQSNGTVRWEGYQEWRTNTGWEHNNGLLNLADFGVRTSISLFPGRWRFSIIQKESAFGEVWSDFQVSGPASQSPDQERHPNIKVVTRPNSELTPLEPYGGSAVLVPKENGGLDVLGKDFPPNTPIYLLLYRSIPGTSNDYQLVSKQAVVSDSLGSIITELSGPFDFGQTYLAIGISDPDIPVYDKDSPLMSINHPYDWFELVGPAAKPSTLSSCPGAPQQRMTINQRGYVCTQSDSVRLRQGPSRSAEVLIELPTGSQFTVTGGPSCADNWSWWQLQTDDGNTGWMAEGGDEDDPYFICALP
jgi:SH3 domain-containing protein